MMLEAAKRRSRYSDVMQRAVNRHKLTIIDETGYLQMSHQQPICSYGLRRDVMGARGSNQKFYTRGFERLAMLWQALIATRAPRAETSGALAEFRTMRVIGLAGWSGAGKTTLIVKLIPYLRERGIVVSTLKHAHHAFDVDQPGKDSYLHREAGAREVLVASSRLNRPGLPRCDVWVTRFELSFTVVLPNVLDRVQARNGQFRQGPTVRYECKKLLPQFRRRDTEHLLHATPLRRGPLSR